LTAPPHKIHKIQKGAWAKNNTPKHRLGRGNGSEARTRFGM